MSYGTVHKVTRERFAARMRAGEVFNCWRPGCLLPDVPITYGVKWDLGHVDREFRDEFGYRHPEHRRCNRTTLTHAKAARPERPAASPARAGGGPVLDGPVVDLDDPRAAGLDDPTVVAVRMSRHWLPDSGFDLRCGDCRRLGGPCEVAREFEAEHGAAA